MWAPTLTDGWRVLEKRAKRIRLWPVLIAGLVGWFGQRPVQAADQQPARTIEIHAKQFKFEPAAITLKKGETVKLVLISDDVPHGLAVAGLAIHADMVKGHPSTLVVTPEETGDFLGKCSKFCGAGHRDMHFVVHVVP
jgi:cytochrome c oxidase subunit 2